MKYLFKGNRIKKKEGKEGGREGRKKEGKEGGRKEGHDLPTVTFSL